MVKLKEGSKIPSFTNRLQSGATITQEDLSKGKVVLYFYPQDNTPTCTEEACNLRDHYAALQHAGFKIYGVSPDSERKHQNSIKKYQLPFELISDPELTLVKKFGVWGPKKLFGREYDGVLRTTFVLENGIVRRIIDEVKSKSHAAQILQ